MKIRNGFVSNSSTASFCIVGVSSDDIINKITEADNMFKEAYLDYGVFKTENMGYYGYGNDVEYAGLWAEKLLKDKTIPEAKDWFQNYVYDKFEIHVDKDDIEFIYGEVGN